jgi:hypothetical protein
MELKNPKPNIPVDGPVALQESIMFVGLLTYITLILADTDLRNVVVTQLAAIKAAGGDDPGAIEKATNTVTVAMATWGFPQSTIDQIANGELSIEANLFQKIPNGLPNAYGVSGCTAITVQPALALLKAN